MMKVIRDTVVTAGLSIRQSQLLRHLEAGEVAQIVEGPMEEETCKVPRFKVKVVKDATEGWVALTGYDGTIFLEQA